MSCVLCYGGFDSSFASGHWLEIWINWQCCIMLELFCKAYCLVYWIRVLERSYRHVCHLLLLCMILLGDIQTVNAALRTSQHHSTFSSSSICIVVRTYWWVLVSFPVLLVVNYNVSEKYLSISLLNRQATFIASSTNRAKLWYWPNISLGSLSPWSYHGSPADILELSATLVHGNLDLTCQALVQPLSRKSETRDGTLRMCQRPWSTQPHSSSIVSLCLGN